MKKLLIGAIVTAVTAAGAVKKAIDKNAKELQHEQTEQERLRLEQLRIDAQRREMEANNQRAFISAENAKKRRAEELNEIRRMRSASPIQYHCPNCNGVRILDRMNGIMSCPFCDGKEQLIPAHRYQPELDDVQPREEKQDRNQAYTLSSVLEWVNTNSKIVFIVCGVLLFWWLIVLGASGSRQTNKEPPKTTITMPATSEKYKNSDYRTVCNAIAAAGFRNISVMPMEDLITGWIVKENTVDRVEVNGVSSYSIYEEFEPDVQIVVFYHSFTIKHETTSTSPAETTVEHDTTATANENDNPSETTAAPETTSDVSETETSISIDTSTADKTTTTPTTKITPTSRYEVAYRVKFQTYSIFYLFDTDTNEVTIFDTTEPQAKDTNSYVGNLADGVSFQWGGLNMRARMVTGNENALTVSDASGNVNTANKINLAIVNQYFTENQ